MLQFKNRKVFFEYFILDKWIAGIQLVGTEVKSIRDGKVSITDSYCYFYNNILYLKGSQIELYDNGSYMNHDPKRDRVLLLKKKELRKIKEQLSEKGLSLVVISLFENEKGLFKLELGLGKGKKLYDKRNSIKEKDLNFKYEYFRFR